MTTAGREPRNGWWERWKSAVLMVLITGSIGGFTGVHFGILAYSAFGAGRVAAGLTWLGGAIVISVVPPLTAYRTERPPWENETSAAESAVPETGE